MVAFGFAGDEVEQGGVGVNFGCVLPLRQQGCQLGEPQVSLDELGAVARNQIQRALDGLKAK